MKKPGRQMHVSTEVAPKMLESDDSSTSLHFRHRATPSLLSRLRKRPRSQMHSDTLAAPTPDVVEPSGQVEQAPLPSVRLK